MSNSMFDELKEIIRSYNVKYFNPNYGGLFRGCFGVGGIKLPYLKLVRIMPET